MVGTSLSRTASFVGKSVKEAARIFHIALYADRNSARRHAVSLIPRGDTIFKEGDQVYFMTVKKGLKNSTSLR